jgi:acetolactate synthase-1/3 small subunit
MHRHSTPRLPHLQTPRAPSAEEAVTNILYNTPAPSTEPYKRHLLNCLVQNEPGVLSRVSGILAGRGFNIDSLVVCQTEIRDLSRMCIVLKGQDGVVEQARRQLEDLVCPLNIRET